ncbi:hypothetical protein CANARDRAFT_26541 [[Candida] arabinofermentans NRRL YB-2248]|uniref:Phosphatase n=1 Tax=[Candida] arabinofermentans NRRL YB-2248 TaxID=983967 RepID=A0A1E4T5T0_9ASCO|nr:hypothetical protein CANARDRAFT_26541 [[Candida] arabinofermentans NRRL YB-2248]
MSGTTTTTTKTTPKAILFTDWDGTVTLQDSNDYLTDHLGFGYDKRKVINDAMLIEERSFRDGFDEMLKSIPANGVSFQKCIEELLIHIQLDPGFKETYEWCFQNDIPVYVISSGMKPIIEVLLKNLVGEEAMKHITIVSNDVEINGDDWNIVYKDETPFGHDKAISIDECLSNYDMTTSKPLLFYCGDGVSDLSAAKSCDLLFARRGKDLVKFCSAQGIHYTQFDSFKDILSDMKSILSGEKKLEDCFEE